MIISIIEGASDRNAGKLRTVLSAQARVRVCAALPVIVGDAAY